MPLLDLSGTIRFAGTHQPVPLLQAGYSVTECTAVRGDLFSEFVKRFWTIFSMFLLFLGNRSLLAYLSVARGRLDPRYPYDKAIAFTVAGVLFLCIITLYASLYFIHLPCLHYIYRDRPFARRIVADFITNFYFSTVTITTLGYGDMSPKNHLWAELITSMEAINGLVAFGGLVSAIFGVDPRESHEAGVNPEK
jgi:voltage-gated potassium channel Kch